MTTLSARLYTPPGSLTGEAIREGSGAATLAATAPGRGRVLAVTGFWGIVVAIDVLNDWLIPGLADGRPPLATVVRDSATWWSSWIVFTPAVLAASGRVAAARPARAALAWLVLAGVVVTLHLVVTAFLFTLTVPGSGPTLGLAARFAVQFTLGEVLTLAGLLMTWHLYGMWQSARGQAVHARALSHRARHADRLEDHAALARLRRELDVHLLLNVLNSASGEVRSGRAEAAVTMLARAGDLVRASAGAADETEVPLATELELVDRYIAVESARFGSALSVQVQVDGDARAARVPPLILQPLVENAIRHGAAVGPGGAARTVHLSARRAGAELVIEVRNPATTGTDLPVREGQGLSVVRRRIERTCGAGATLEVRREAGGFLARLRLPCRPAARAGAQP